MSSPPSAARPPHPALLVALTMVGPLALNIFMPSMAGLEEAFGTDKSTVQLTLTLYLIGLAGAQLVYGPLSDRFGRRPVLLSGIALFVVANVACALAPTIGTLIVARVFQAVGGCAGMVLTRAIVRDVYGRDRAASVLGYITTAMAVAPMLAPVLGGYLDVWFGWRAGFVTLFLIGAAVWAWSLAALTETHHDPQPLPGIGGMLASYADLMRRPVFLGYALSSAFNSASFFAFLAGAPFIMADVLHRPPNEYGLMFILISAGFMAGSFAAGRLSARVGPARMALLGTLVAVAGIAVLAGFAVAGIMTSLVLFLPTTVMAFGNGVALPNAVAVAIGANPRLAGTASGLLGFLQMTIGAGASLAVGLVLSDSALPVAVCMLVAAALAAVALLYGRRAEVRAGAAAPFAPAATGGASD